MKKAIKSFTFYFFILGIIVVSLNLAGQDDKNILLIGLNPILVSLDNPTCRPVINSVPYLWHILSLITMTMYGAVLDGIKVILKKKQ